MQRNFNDFDAYNRLRLRRPLFWDINETQIENALGNSRLWVILRVFEYGTLDDIQDTIDMYGKENVKDALLSEEKLEPMTRCMAFLFLDIDKEGRYIID